MQVQQTIPLLRIFDVEQARAFYTGFLGFQVDWEHRFEPTLPIYMQIARGGCVLHLTQHHGDCCPGSTVFLWMTGLAEYHQEIMARNNGALRPGLEKTFYESLSMQVTDPFGNRLRFNEKLPSYVP
jgi:uncharacterized glyoxalase superfamily protein PhnB